MRGYTFLITTRTIDDYIGGCIELFLKNNFKIVLWFTLFSYICGCNNATYNETNYTYIDTAKDNRIKTRRAKPLVGNSGYTAKVRKYEMGGSHERVVNGVVYRDRVKSGVR